MKAGFNCDWCGKRIGSSRPHHLLRERRIVCAGCIERDPLLADRVVEIAKDRAGLGRLWPAGVAR